MTGPPRFEVPTVSDACPGGWGPGASVPPALAGAPYAPFNKADRVGRIADFTAAGLKFGGECCGREWVESGRQCAEAPQSAAAAAFALTSFSTLLSPIRPLRPPRPRAQHRRLQPGRQRGGACV